MLYYLHAWTNILFTWSMLRRGGLSWGGGWGLGLWPLCILWPFLECWGCFGLHPSKQPQTIYSYQCSPINARHWKTVHEVVWKQPQNSQIILKSSAVQPSTACFSLSTSSLTVAAAASSSYSQSCSEKTDHRHSQLQQVATNDIINSLIDFKVRLNWKLAVFRLKGIQVGFSLILSRCKKALTMHFFGDTSQKIKMSNLPQKLKMIHLSANKMISSKIVIASYFTSVEIQK